MKHFHILSFVLPIFLSGCTDSILITNGWVKTPLENDEIVGSYWLPIAKFPITFKRKSCELSVDIAKADFFPDLVHHYNVMFHKNSLTADNVTVGTDDAGLLQTVNASSEPQQSAIIGKLFEIAGDVVKVAGADVPTPPKHCDPKVDLDLTLSIDPNSRDAQALLQNALGPELFVAVSAKPLDSTERGNIDQSNPCVPEGKKPVSVSGVCYRPAWPYQITVSVTEVVDGVDRRGRKSARIVRIDKSIGSIIPDPNRILNVSLKRHGPTKSDIKLSFSHGVLTKYENNQPSTALAWISIPANILKGVLGLDPSSSSSSGTKK